MHACQQSDMGPKRGIVAHHNILVEAIWFLSIGYRMRQPPHDMVMVASP